ncbi:G patch domain-containing protein 2-like isoform X2 [Dunckerocampus dactyliophorus]|uniref:G patch domain-containing protein 2-like isoform X2 n=1 Tax=Dunckerocampus dactyliophorus TaxID=161453 RepID=UPI002405BC27|nr:G patch domain-containing protein 2-like isoform X2 [Dunckerocampus dactyliophorus]
MDELVQDLVSALEHTSEQSKLGELWEEMVLSPRHRRRQVRRRRGQKHRCESSLHPPERRHHWVEASESSLDETSQNSWRNSPPLLTTSAANCSNSDDMSINSQWHSLVSRPIRTGQPSWPESDSLSENNLGRQLKRKRRIKRMNPPVQVRLQHKLKVSAMERKKLRPRPSRMQHLSRLKNSSSGWVGRNRQSDGVSLMGKQRWNRKITLEHRDAAEENMSEGETSSTCSSDPGLFTNDEGRQGDDEQSDWFFEGDCGIGSSVASLLPNWDSDNHNSRDVNRPSPTSLPSLRGYCSHLKRLPRPAASYIRTNRGKFSSKGNSTPEFVERLRHLSHDHHYRDFSAVGHHGQKH